MDNLIRETLANPTIFWAMVATFWGMVEALGTVAAVGMAGLAAIFLYLELKLLRGEATARGAAGINWAMDYFHTERFLTNKEYFFRYGADGRYNDVLSVFVLLLADLDLAAELIKMGFITERMVSIATGEPLTAVLRDIEAYRSDSDLNERITRIISFKPRAYELLGRLAEAFAGVQAEAKEWREAQGD